MAEPIPMRRELKLGAPPSEIWPLISNTNRFNRALGLPAMTQEAPPPGAFHKPVRMSLLGIPLKWKELPFEWVEGRYYKAVREFDSGPIARFEGSMELVPDGKGCTIKIASDFTPRNALGEFIIRYATGRKAINDAEALIKRFDRCVCSADTETFPARRTKTPAREAAFKAKSGALLASNADKRAAERLVGFLRDGYDDELARMRPFELADRWGLPRCETLKAFLHAVKAGLLDMNWDVLCPNCAGPKENHAHLKELKDNAHCPSCGITYGVSLDEVVELRFTVSPAVRPVETALFCVGNPAHAPFALAQLILRPGGEKEATVDLASESYRLRNLSIKRCFTLRPSPEGSARLEIDFAAPDDREEILFKPGAVELAIKAGGDTQLVRLEKESWKEKGAKASFVTALQDFRDMFSSEVLAPGVEISIKNVAVMFSDLKDSTALYERIGDATAYAIVRDHFDYMFAIIAKREGAVVKTIGDAVMAVFSSAAPALEAALEIQEHVAELNARLKPKPPVTIKLGVHMGPAIAINANEALDYFGTTINVGARVQNESKGGDVVITQAVISDTGACGCIAGHPCEQEDFEIRLKGLKDAFKLRRLIPKL